MNSQFSALARFPLLSITNCVSCNKSLYAETSNFSSSVKSLGFFFESSIYCFLPSTRVLNVSLARFFACCSPILVSCPQQLQQVPSFESCLVFILLLSINVSVSC